MLAMGTSFVGTWGQTSRHISLDTLAWSLLTPLTRFASRIARMAMQK